MQLGPDSGAHACDVALVMAGWLLLDRVGRQLGFGDWNLWRAALDAATAATGMA